MQTENIDAINPELQVLLNNKHDGYKYRERRQNQWLENYTLYRDKVEINRLTQRQSVNIPLMKQTIKTLLKDVDDMPVLYFENLDNDKQKEVFQNEYWSWTVDKNNSELQDIVDKKQVFLFGRSFDQWQVEDGCIRSRVVDPHDILVSRYVNPYDLHSSRFLIHTHIFKPLSLIEANEDYDKEAVKRLKTHYATDLGLVEASDNLDMLVEKNNKMRAMGVKDVEDPILGETYIELTLHFVYDTRENSDEEELFLKVEAADRELLMSKPLEEVIGKTEDNYWKTHFPYVSWADDLELQDFWSDGVADIIRTTNKVLNSWFSQLVENRTLRNFGMHYYDATFEGFRPNSFNPTPWGWYPLPGKPQDIVQKVDIPDLSESLDEMTFLITMAEKASGATATQQGVTESRQITFGEIELALVEAKKRVKGMSKFYTPAWKQRGKIFLRLIEAAGDKLDAVKIYKSGRNSTDIYQREVDPNKMMTKSGYQIKIWSQEEKDVRDTNALQKINAAINVMPDNPKLREVYQRKVLEFAGLSPDEINEIAQAQKEKQDMMIRQQTMGMQTQAEMQQPGLLPQPEQQMV